jgi:hypothetical protein
VFSTVEAEGTRINSWGNAVRDDRRKATLCSQQLREQEKGLFLTAVGTLFEIYRRKAALCS